MSHLNVEVKARCDDPDRVRKLLAEQNAEFKGTDHQVDTYFDCPAGRLKLREGNIEHSLIHYDRQDLPGPKQALVALCHPRPDPALRAVLSAALGVRQVVRKTREIYFIDNVKFHVDAVEGLGSFVEIEAQTVAGRRSERELLAQCRRYIDLLGIAPEDLVDASYSDLVQGA